MELKEYIFKNYKNKLEFANEQGVQQTVVSRWISKGFIVFEGKLYSERRVLIKSMNEEQNIEKLKVWIEDLKDYCDHTGHPNIVDFAKGISNSASEILEEIFED